MEADWLEYMSSNSIRFYVIIRMKSMIDEWCRELSFSKGGGFSSSYIVLKRRVL